MLSTSRFISPLAGALLALFCAGNAAVAQIIVDPGPPRYYPPPGYMPAPVPGTGGYMVPPPGRYDDRRMEDYEARPRRRTQQDEYGQRDYRRRDEYRRRDYGYDDYSRPRRRPQQMGMVCVTSRGECSTGSYRPIGEGCRCIIPGFGRKRGSVQY